jgi:hypothetical protein
VAPLELLLVAVIVLLALLGQARPVAAPALTLPSSTSAAATSAPSPGSITKVASQRNISVSNPVAPAPPRPVTSRQAAPEAPLVPGSALCPAQAGSRLPCELS